MPNWKSTLDIKDLHIGYRAGTVTVQELAAGVAARFKTNRFAKDNLFAEDIIEQLEDVAEDKSSTIDMYDEALAELYDFADQGHRIWVKTV